MLSRQERYDRREAAKLEREAQKIDENVPKPRVALRGRAVREIAENDENEAPRAVAKRNIGELAAVAKIPRRPLRDITGLAQNIQPAASSSKKRTGKRQPSLTLYKELQELGDHGGFIRNNEEFECEICYCDIDVGAGVRLRQCLHQFCFDCVKGAILYSESAEIRCPGDDLFVDCDSFILDSEIRAILSTDEYETFTKRSLRLAETNIAGSVHCKAPDCDSWCIVEDNINVFTCFKCDSVNCIPCQAIHPGIDCKQYQENPNSDQSTKKYLEELIRTGEAMKCPKCQIVIVKRNGCDGIICTMCLTELCWATKQARWGPGGYGDYSGGCGCNREEGRKCHPNCRDCH